MAAKGILNITFQGVTPIQNRLKNADTAEKVERALDRGAMWVEQDAKRLVRVDTGRLKNSINILKRGRFARSIGTSVEYAAAQEFGRPDMPRYGYTPYLRPAARKNKGNILREIKKAIEQ